MTPLKTWLAILLGVGTVSCAGLACAQEPERPAGRAGRIVWPGEDWQTAAPESHGLSGAALDVAAAYAQKYGGGSGCVIRGGYLVKEWGDPKKLADIKSATKGAVGTTVLGLAVDGGLVGLEDLAVKHYPLIGAEGRGAPQDRLAEITIRHLATMTAGFDDGRPPKLVYRPGTDGFYSNDCANMLAELLTLRFGEDLAVVLKRAVMDPIGVPAGEWKWRENSYRAKSINGLRSREFASGITITHRALRGSATSTCVKENGTAGGSSRGSSSAPRPGPPTCRASCPITLFTGREWAGNVSRHTSRRLLGSRSGR